MREKLTILAGGMLCYRYSTGRDGMDFNFHMLCEVGQPYQPWFLAEIERRNLRVEHGRNLDAAPWCADFVMR